MRPAIHIRNVSAFDATLCFEAGCVRRPDVVVSRRGSPDRVCCDQHGREYVVQLLFARQDEFERPLWPYLMALPVLLLPAALFLYLILTARPF